MQEQQVDYQNRGSTSRRHFLTVENNGCEDKNNINPNSLTKILDLRNMNFSDRPSNSQGNLPDTRSINTYRRGYNDGEVGIIVQSAQFNSKREQNNDENDSNSQDEFDENQNNLQLEQDVNKSPIERRGGVMVNPDQKKKSKFNDLIFQLRMKNKVRRLAKFINSRMQKNLTFGQFKMIGDKASDSSYLQMNTQKEASNAYADHDTIEQRRSFVFQFLQRIDIFLPVFDPRSKMKVFLEFMNLLSIVVIFYSFCIIISFKLKIDTIISDSILQIALGFIFVNSFVNLNTGYYEGMKLQTDRQQMFYIYYKTHFFVDILSFSSIIILFIFDKTQFLADDSQQKDDESYIEVSDIGTLMRFLVFIPFFQKLRDFSKFMIELEEKVIFQKQVQNIIQLVKLFSSIILIDHFIACIWIVSAKLSFNLQSNWQTKKDWQNLSWFRQYTVSFYYSTVTMTTVGKYQQYLLFIIIQYFPYIKFLFITINQDTLQNIFFENFNNFSINQNFIINFDKIFHRSKFLIQKFQFGYINNKLFIKGYGDIVPTNQTEYLVSIFMMIISSGVFGFSLNQIGIIFTEMQLDNKEMRRKMNIINTHMEKRNVKHPLRTQIRQYLEYVWRENNEQFQNDSAAIIEQLNDSLKKELQLHQNEKIINYLKKHYSETFIQKAFTLIQEVQCKPQQLIYKQGQIDDIAIYMIEKGKVEVFYKTKSIKNSTSHQNFIAYYFINFILTAYLIINKEINEGQIFGIKNFYTGKAFDLNMRANGFVNLLRIRRDDFMHMLEQFPDDREAFCHIRDNLTLYSDGWKANSSCPSCGSYKHHLIDCDFIHFVPNKQNIRLRHSYIPPNSYQRERQKPQPQKKNKRFFDEFIESDVSEEFRKRAKFQTRYDLPQYMEQLYFDQIEFIEEYENKYLNYNFDFTYIIKDKEDTEEENDEQLLDDDAYLQFQKEGEGSAFQFGKQITNSLDQSAVVQFDQISEVFEKQISITNQLEKQKSVTDGSPAQKKLLGSPNKGVIKEQNQKQQNPQCIFKGPRKQVPNLHQPMNSPCVRNSYRPKSVIFSEALEKQCPQSDFSKMSTEQQKNSENSNGLNIQLQQVQTSTIHTYVPESSNANVINGQPTSYTNIQNQFQQNQNMHQSLFKIDEVQTIPMLQLGRMTSVEQINQSPQQQNKLPQLQYSFSVSNQNDDKHLQPYSVAVRNQDKKNSSIKRAFSMKMKKFQNNILQNIEKIFQKNGQQQLIKNQDSIDVDNKDFYGQQQIFRSFDKQKNFYIYFPFNNLNYLLMKLEIKSQIGKKIYLDILQQKKKQPYGHQQSSSHTLFRSKYEKLKLKSDRLLNKGSRGNNSSMYGSFKQRTVDYDNPNQEQLQQQYINGSVQRKSAFFDKNQIESPSGSLHEKQLQLYSARSYNNHHKLSFNGLFSRNDESFEINNPGFNGSELSPNIQDMEFSTPALHDIHRISFQAKKFNFSQNL